MLLQELFDLPDFFESLVWFVKTKVLGLLPVLNRPEWHIQDHILPVVCQPYIVVHSTVELRHAGLQAFLECTDTRPQELLLFLCVLVLGCLIRFDDVFTIQVKETCVLCIV